MEYQEPAQISEEVGYPFQRGGVKAGEKRKGVAVLVVGEGIRVNASLEILN